MKSLRVLLVLSAISFCVCCTNEVIDLSGEWRFATDPNNVGIAERWFTQELPDTIILPGSMMTNGKGDVVDVNTPWVGRVNDSSFWKSPLYAPYREPDNFKIPFWLQPNLYYKGAAWYQREIDVPQHDANSSVILTFERAHWQTMVWVDDNLAATANALCAPQIFDLTGRLTPGRHTLTVMVDNDIHDINPGFDSHSVSDHTQGNWNGIAGAMTLTFKRESSVNHIDIFPSVEDNSVTVKAEVWASRECDEQLVLKVGKDESREQLHLKEGLNCVSATLAISEPVKLWDEYSPDLYQLKYKLTGSGDKGETSFGFRKWSTEGGVLSLNGHRVFIRGTLHCGTFPETGYPSTDKSEWLREMNKMREYGLNSVRFHSWCPPEAAFQAADELGMYLHVECSAWAKTLGDGKPTDKYIVEEAKRIVRAYGSHPSFCLMMYGNEPAGAGLEQYLTDFVNYWKENDGRHLYAAGAGWPNLPVNEFMCNPEPRIQRWKEGLASIINSTAPSTDYDWTSYTAEIAQPMISHEIGQWCVYPDFSEIEKYTGVYKARNFEIFRDFLKNNGMSDLAGEFLYASGRLQTLCYKADIEAALRTPRFGGFELLGINDFTGQGTALVGPLNAFWEEKGYTDGEEYRHFCNDIVLLARMKKLVLNNSETFEAGIETANFKSAMEGCDIHWQLKKDDGTTVGGGTFNSDVPLGNCNHVGDIRYDLSSIDVPTCLTLEVSIDQYSNSWNIWVYPSEAVKTGSAIMADKLDDAVLQQLENGASVLLSFPEGSLKPELGGDIKVGFSSIFWNTAWTKKQAPHTLGILCDPAHPALAGFPTEKYSDFQWQDIMSHTQAFRLDKLESDIQPIVRIIDDWFTARPLSLCFECRIGKGKLVVCGVDFSSDIENRPASRQLLASVLNYMNSSAFEPEAVLSVNDVRQIQSSL